ncbi:MAG: acetyltransferase [Hydrogenothermaceae bacterium]|nr:acetyltransferase [Hydrogenothermaceae bacterium]
MEITKVYIYGASGHGKVVYDVLMRNGYYIKGFIDDDRSKRELIGLEVISFDNFLTLRDDNSFVALGIGDNKAREEIFKKLEENNIKILSVIDKSAILSNIIKVGIGTVIFANSVINNSSYIGKGCIINTSAVIEHDCFLSDFVHVSPNAALAGNVRVGKYTHIGIGASIKQNINIGENVIIGAGSVIIDDIPDNVVVVGNPGRIIRKNET